MTATYTFDVFSTLDGFASYNGGDWGGYWGKQGPELLDHRLAAYSEEQRLVLGANTYRQFAQLLGPSTEPDELDPRPPLPAVGDEREAHVRPAAARVDDADAVALPERQRPQQLEVVLQLTLLVAVRGPDPAGVAGQAGRDEESRHVGVVGVERATAPAIVDRAASSPS